MKRSARAAVVSFATVAIMALGGAAYHAIALERTFDPGDPGDSDSIVVKLSPGVDQLASAIERAGRGGTVLLDPGVHIETEPVAIPWTVTLRGLDGAVIEDDTAANLQKPFFVDPVLHIRYAAGVRVENLTFRTRSGGLGGTAVLIENAGDVHVTGNRFEMHQFPIVVQHGREIVVNGNDLSRWGQQAPRSTSLSEPEPGGLVQGVHRSGPGGDGTSTGQSVTAGLVAINGSLHSFESNTVTGFDVGIWVTSQVGTITGNLMRMNRIAVRLCGLPDGIFIISGSAAGSEKPASGWTVTNNTTLENNIGYLVAHGANHNSLHPPHQYGRTSNAVYDLEFGGEDCRDHCGPPSCDNEAHVMGRMKVIDCGERNTIQGGNVLSCR